MGEFSLAALWPIVSKLLPLLLDIITAARREGYMQQGEDRIVARQLAAKAIELGNWNEAGTQVSNLSGDDLDALLTGVRKSEGS